MLTNREGSMSTWMSNTFFIVPSFLSLQWNGWAYANVPFWLASHLINWSCKTVPGKVNIRRIYPAIDWPQIFHHPDPNTQNVFQKVLWYCQLGQSRILLATPTPNSINLPIKFSMREINPVCNMPLRAVRHPINLMANTLILLLSKSNFSTCVGKLHRWGSHASGGSWEPGSVLSAAGKPSATCNLLLASACHTRECLKPSPNVQHLPTHPTQLSHATPFMPLTSAQLPF